MTEKVAKSLADFFYCQNKISEIDLNLNYTTLKDFIVEIIFDSFNTFNLCSFSISMRSCGLNNDAILALCSVFSINLQVHTRLLVDLSMNLVLDNEASEFGAALKTFANIKQLDINLESCEMGNEGIVFIEDAILAMRNLEYLQLNVIKNGLTEETISKIIKEFNLMNNLKHLDFKARNNAIMNPRRIEKLYNNAKDMKHLKTKKTTFR